MIHSMTGFGRSNAEVEGTRFDVEVRSVNHRHLDVRVKVPKAYNTLEAEVRSQVQGRLDRGKVDLSVVNPSGSAAATKVKIDTEVATQYIEVGKEFEERYGLSVGLDVSSLFLLPGVSRTVEVEIPEEEVRTAVLAAVDQALSALEVMRAAEGKNLERDVRERLQRIEELADGLEARSGEVMQTVKERLTARAKELTEEVGGLDEARLHQEVVMAADKLDVVEEIVRLRSHVGQFVSILDETRRGCPGGRRLDFLLQEMGREANTIGSKANDASMAHSVVELKTELERIREQVQNIE
jgi:uncharacterized protein (TIGR00255 family)